jgi:hypothetical protein
MYELNGLPPYIPNLVYGGKRIPPANVHYGTAEKLYSLMGHVTNVHSAKDKLKTLIPRQNTSRPIMGRLHIFKDKPMEFESL